jgi:hypothetical protein
MKIKLTYILVILLVISLGLNAYHYVYKVGFVRGQQAGANMVSNSVAQQFNETGKVQMMYEGKNIVLVPERPVAIKGDVNKMFE